MSPFLRKIIKIFILVFLLLSFLLVFTALWLSLTWGYLSASEIVYHMNHSFSGANREMIVDYLLKYLLPAILLFVSAIVIAIFAHRKSKALAVYIVFLIMACGLFFASGYMLEKKAGLISYVYASIKSKNGSEDDFIGENYKDPNSVQISFPERKRNLIYIYLESIETTYADTKNGGAFQENVIPELVSLAQENEDFSGGEELNGGVNLSATTWTIAAMFAQSSGLPLKIPISGNDMEKEDKFFPNLITLGDILEDEGYKQILLIGSDAAFGGRDLYYTSHGNYEIHDYNYAQKEGLIPKDYNVWWGYEDEKLFQFAKNELSELSKKDEPFNLTILIVDTHFEDGYICNLCGSSFGDNQYANVIACSSKQINEFVRWIQQQGFYDNTTIILAGDHITMDEDFCDDVSSSYQRKSYVCIINSALSSKNKTKRNYTTLDLFPTTLASLGVSIQGEQLGLGVNLYSEKKTLLETYDFEDLNNLIKNPSYFMTKQF